MVGQEYVGGHLVFTPTVILKPDKVKMARTTRIDSFVKIEGGEGVSFGEYVHIASFSHINAGGGRVIFEDHSGCASHCIIIGASPDWNSTYASAAEREERHLVRRYLTRIGKYAILFAGVIVLPGVTIGEGAIIKPGSLVKNDVEPWAIMEGSPAIRVGTRNVTDIDDYQQVQQLGEDTGTLLRADAGVAGTIGQTKSVFEASSRLWRQSR